MSENSQEQNVPSGGENSKEFNDILDSKIERTESNIRLYSKAGDSYGIEGIAEVNSLRIRRRILGAFRNPRVIELGDDGLTANQRTGLEDVVNQVKSIRDAGHTETIYVDSQIDLDQDNSLILTKNLHEFSVVQSEVAQVFRELGMKMAPTDRESDFKHEMGHLIHVINSEKDAVPYVGFRIVKAFKEGKFVGWGSNPVSMYEGELTLEELKLFRRGDVDDNEKNDLAGSEILDSVE